MLSLYTIIIKEDIMAKKVKTKSINNVKISNKKKPIAKSSREKVIIKRITFTPQELKKVQKMLSHDICNDLKIWIIQRMQLANK